MSSEVNFRYMSFLNDLYERHDPNIEVCNEDELLELEKKWRTNLPLAYKEVFRIKGKHGAFGLRRNEFSVDEYDKMQEAVKDIISRNHLQINLNEVFVFSCFASLGNFCFYRLDEGDNPPVYIYIEGDDTYHEAYRSFVEFIKDEDWYKALRSRYSK